MALPTNWNLLTPQEQLFVVIDLERTARGLPAYLGLSRPLSAAAQWAALRLKDPSLAKGLAVGLNQQKVKEMGSTLAVGYSTLEADFVWMYDDGWGGALSATSNIACTSSGAPGCWGHRDQLLGSDGSYNPGVGLRCTNCEMGTGFAVVRGAGSFTSLIERPKNGPSPMYFTWARNVEPYLPSTTAMGPTTTTVGASY